MFKLKSAAANYFATKPYVSTLLQSGMVGIQLKNGIVFRGRTRDYIKWRV
jgi:hypothetical protein